MDQDYSSIIDQLRGKGYSNEQISNILVYTPQYSLDSEEANRLLGIEQKKSPEFTIAGSLDLQPSAITSDSSLEEGQRVEAAYANPSIDETTLEPAIKQWRDYNLATGLNMDVDMYDVDEMRMAYINDAVGGAVANNLFDEGVTKEDIIGNGRDKGVNQELLGVALNYYSDHFKEHEETIKSLSASEDQIKARESASRSLSIIKEYTKRMQQDFVVAHKEMLSSNEEYRNKVEDIQKRLKAGEISKETAQGQISRFFRSESSEFFQDRFNSYRDEIIESLPEELSEDLDFLEDLSEDIYNRTGGQMKLNLDKDGVYNEDTWGITSMFYNMAATTMDMTSGVISSASGLFLGEMGGLEVHRTIQQASAELRGEAREYDLGEYEGSWYELDYLGHSAMWLLDGGAGMVPYLGLAYGTGGAGLFLTGTMNTYSDSKLADIDRINEGLDPIFEVNEVGGETKRILMSLGVGGIQAASNGLLKGIAGRLVGKPIGGFSERFVAKTLGGTAGDVTRSRALGAYLMAQGIDAGAEGGQEVLENTVQRAFEVGLGNSDLTMSEFIDETQVSFVEGVRGTLGVGLGGAVVHGNTRGRQILGIDPDLITGPMAATNSIADPSALNAEKDSPMPLSSPVDRETYGKTEEKIREHKIENEKRYRVIKLRHPEAFKSIQLMDEQLALMAHKAEAIFSKAEEGELSKDQQNEIESIQRKFKATIEARHRLFTSFEGESTTLTQAEATAVERGQIARHMQEMDLDIRQTREEMEKMKEAEGTLFYDSDSYAEKEARIESLQARQATARKLLGDLEAAHNLDAQRRSESNVKGVNEASARAVKAAQAELMSFLGIQKQPFDLNSTSQTSSTWSAETQSKNHYEDADSKGSTYTLDGVNQAGKPKASVSIFNERSEVVDGEMTEEEMTKTLQEYYEKNKDILEGNEDILAIGTFYDAESGKTYIDISTVIGKEAATKLGQEYNQISVWDLGLMKEIKTGGDGTVKGEMKSEADRIADIRKILEGERKTENDASSQSMDGEPTTNIDQSKANRGIIGQFKDYTANKDGSLGVISEGPLNRQMAKWINSKLQRTIKNIIGDGKNLTIRVHSTAQSGHFADGNEGSAINGYFVQQNGTDITIHINPEFISQRSSTDGKSLESVLLEEFQHAMIGPVMNKIYMQNPALAEKMLDEMFELASLHPDGDLVARVKRKQEAYAKYLKGKDQDRELTEAEKSIIFEEAIFEATSELAKVWKSVKPEQQKSILDKIRVLFNKIFNAVGAKEFVITDVTNVEQLVDAMAAIHDQGAGVSIEQRVENRIRNNEKASRSNQRPVRVSKLPEDGEFSVRFWMPQYGKYAEAGIYKESKLVDMKFNGKWHFVNWWKRATSMGKDRHGGWEVNLGDGFVPLDADAMKKWKMSPPKRRKTSLEKERDEWKATQEQFTAIRELHSSMAPTEDYYQNQQARNKANEEAAVELFGQEEVDRRKEAYQSGPALMTLDKYTSEELNQIRLKLEENYGLRKAEDADDISADRERASFFENDTRTIKDYQDHVENVKKKVKKIVCGGVSFSCPISEEGLIRLDLMRIVNESMYGKEPTIDNMSQALATLAEWSHIMRVTRTGRDIRSVDEEIKETFEKASSYIESVHPPSMLPKNHRDFFGVFAGILAVTSNGVYSTNNTRVAINIYDNFLTGIASGKPPSEALSSDYLNKIREANPDILVNKKDINKQRSKSVVRGLEGLLKNADKFFDPKTGAFDSDKMAAHYGRKRRNKDYIQARGILGMDAEKTGEHAAGMMGYGKRAHLANEKHNRRIHHALQGNLVLPTEDLIVSQDVIKAAESLAEAYEVSEAEIEGILKTFKTVEGDPLTESSYGWNNPAVRAVAAMKAIKGSDRGNKAYRDASIKLYALLGRSSAYDSGSSYLNVDETKIRAVQEATAKELNKRFASDGTGKKFTPYHVQQLMFETMTAEMAAYKEGDLKDYSYAAVIDEAIESIREGQQGLDLDMGEGEYVTSIDNMGNLSRERASMSFDFPDAGKMEDEVLAHEHPLWRTREMKDVGMVKQGDSFVTMSDALVSEALQSDKRSMQIMDEQNPVEVGQRVAIRLNLNVKKNTGVPVQTVHAKTATGKALRYSGAVTLKNAVLAVNQNAREKIVTFQENKFPMAAVQGDYASEGVEASQLDGVKAVFNPFREHLFVDASGRAIKSAEEATVIGNTVILRGKIEYFKMDDPILKRGKVESDKGKAKRLLRGDRYERQLKRFQAYAERALGMTFNNRSELEAAYDGMQVGSKVALSESEVVDNMTDAMERASIGGYIKQTKMRQAARKQAGSFLNTTREAIIANPENYITPQNIKKIKNDLQDMTDQELVQHLTDESIGRLSERNDDIGVLAGSEMIRRAVARGEMDRIPAIVAELAAIGTTAGRILRHFRELKSSTPKGLASVIESAVNNNGNQLSDAQKSELNKLTEDLFVQQSKVEDLMRRATAGELVDADLEAAIEEMKATERKLDTFTTKYIEKSWGTLFGQLVQGNLLTTISQIFNVGANMVNAVGHVAVDIVSLPFEAAMMKIGKAMGKDIEDRRKASLMAYMYGFRKFGQGFIEAADQVVTGQDKELSEWRVHRGLAPFRSLKAAFNKDLPLGPDGEGSLSQRSKLFVQGTLGIPAETMFRLLSLGDIPFRRFAEGIDLYQSARSMGLEGEALARYLKYPSKRDLQRARREGRKLTFQEETAASKNVNSVVAALEGMVARGVDSMGFNGQDFAKALFKTMLPFRSTPANILYETFTWVNPYVGTARMANQLRNGDVEESSKTLAKMMLGSITMEAALMLISEGIISGPVKWDEDEEKNMAYDVFPPSSVNISALRRLINGEDPAHQADDYFFKYDKLGMFGAIMSTAVQSTDPEALKERDYSSPAQFFSHTISDFFGAGSMSAISAMMEQSFVQGLNGFIKVLIGDNVERDLENFLNTMFKAGSAAVLPNQLNAFYRSQRGYLPDSRLTRDVGDQGGISGMSERLIAKFGYTIRDRTFGLADYPVRVNWKGEDIQQTPRGANPIAYQLFDITKSRQGSADPLSNEIWRLYEQTEEFTDVCGTPSYATTRKFNVPNITSKKDIKMVKDLGRGYTWINDEEFMAERVYLSTEQINELMKIGGQERYKEAMELIQTSEYRNANDQDRIEMLNDIAGKYNSAKEYGPNGYRRHTIRIFDIMQEIYDAR